MRNYQLVLILKPGLKEADRKKLSDTLKGWLDGLKIAKEEDWGTKNFAFPIKRENSGIYLNLILEGEGLPSDLEKKVGTNDNILRHLLLRMK